MYNLVLLEQMWSPCRTLPLVYNSSGSVTELLAPTTVQPKCPYHQSLRMKNFRCFSMPPIIPTEFLLSFHLWLWASNLKHFVRSSASYCSDPEHITTWCMTDIFTIGSLDSFLSCTRTRRSYQRYLAYSFHGFTKINCERRNVINRRKPKDSDMVWIVIEETDRKVCSVHLVWRLKRKLEMNCCYESYLSKFDLIFVRKNSKGRHFALSIPYQHLLVPSVYHITSLTID